MTIAKNVILNLSLIFLGIILTGCGGSDSNPDGGISGTGEALFKSPTDSSLDFDLELSAVASSGKKSKLARRDHFDQVITVSDVLREGVHNRMKIPVRLLRKALSVKPTQGASKKQLVWTFEETIGDIILSIKLEGELFGDQIFWKMTNSNNDSLMMKGVSHLKGEKGFWDIFDISGEIVAMINWKVVDGVSKLSIQNLNSGSLEFGNSVEFTKNGDDIRLVYYRFNRDRMVEMFWNKTSGEGGIRDEDLNDGELSSWDSTGDDIDVVVAISFDLVLPPKDSLLIKRIDETLGSVDTVGESHFQQGKIVGETIDLNIHNKLNGLSDIISNAQNVQPVATAVGSFIWTYNGTSSNDISGKYFAELEGIPAGEQVRWKLRVSLLEGNEKKLVMHGFSNKKSTKGVWHVVSIFDFIKTAILWNIEDNSKQVIYRQINLLNFNKGDFLRSIESNGQLSFAYFNHTTDKVLRLQFNATDLNGLVEDPAYLDGNAYSWDSSFLNIE